MKVIVCCFVTSLFLHFVLLWQRPFSEVTASLPGVAAIDQRRATRITFEKSALPVVSKKNGRMADTHVSNVQGLRPEKQIVQSVSEKTQGTLSFGNKVKNLRNEVTKTGDEKLGYVARVMEKRKKHTPTGASQVADPRKEPKLPEHRKVIPKLQKNREEQKEASEKSKTVEPPPPAVSADPDVETSGDSVASSAPLMLPKSSLPAALSEGAPKTPSPVLSSGKPKPQSREAFRRAYLALLRERIEAARNYPRRAMRMGLEGRVVLRLTIGATGEILNVSLAEATSAPVLNGAAMKTVQSLRALPPLPKILGERLDVVIPLVYHLGRYGER